MPSIFTRAVHAGERLAPMSNHKPVTTPIHPGVAFVTSDADELDAILDRTQDGYVYRRYQNPTTDAFTQAMAALEGGPRSLAYASGMAAIHGALLAAGVRAGSQVMAARDCYGATYTLLSQLLHSQGVTTHFVDITQTAAVAAQLADIRPVALLCETISNPLLKVADVPALTAAAHAVGAAVIVDSTFTTPYLCQPMAWGVDFVVHSITKYIGGHDDVLGGVVVMADRTHDQAFEQAKMLGANLSPFEAWLALRGLKTLPLRMRQHCINANTVAHWLADHPAVARVNYPGLPDHPQHAMATRLLRDPSGAPAYGGMVSFELRAGAQAAVFRFLESLQLVLPATTLGDVYSLVLYPAATSHRALTPAERTAVGIGPGLVRLSVGIEEAADIIADLDQALAVND